MTAAIHHDGEVRSNAIRDRIVEFEPTALRTYTPTQASISRSAGVFHWTSDGRKLYDYSSGVLVANLGHNPVEWHRKFERYMGWPDLAKAGGQAFFDAVPMTSYNAATEVEAQAVKRLTACLQARPGGSRLQQVMWAASGSEAIQKALWASLALDKSRDIILATRDGFHGKKGLAEAVTGSETDKNRDARVRFLSFPKAECSDISMRGKPFDAAPCIRELHALEAEFGGKTRGQRGMACLITEPYLGGGGSYHPPKQYLQLLQDFCRRNSIVMILDEVQANFGRTGSLFAFETYGIEPDIVVLGKGLANGVPAAAAVGRADIMAALTYGEASDTFSGTPLTCAAVLATLDIYENQDIIGHTRKVSKIIERGLERLRDLPFVKAIRGEDGGMVWGVELADHAGRTAAEIANACVLAAYLGDERGRAVHLLGALAKKVIRISPPLVITADEAADSVDALHACFRNVLNSPVPAAAAR